MAFPVQGTTLQETSEEVETAPRFSNTQVLEVPKIKQEKTNWCWAACGASAVSYMQNTNCTQSDFCLTTLGHTNDKYAKMSQVCEGLRNYNLDSELVYILENHVDINDIKNNIDKSQPLFASRIRGLTGHVVLIHGYNCYDTQNTATIAYMNPSAGKSYTILFDYFANNETTTVGDAETLWVVSTTWNYCIYNICKI